MSISKNLSKICKTLFLALLLVANAAAIQVYGQNTAVDSLKRELGKVANDNKKVDLLNELSDSYFQIDDSISFFVHSNKALSLANHIKYQEGIFSSYYFRAKFFTLYVNGNYDSAKKYLDRLETETNENTKYVVWLAKSYFMKGRMYHQLGFPDSAIIVLNQAEKLMIENIKKENKDIKNVELLFDIYLRLSKGYVDKGNFQETSKCLEKMQELRKTYKLDKYDFQFHNRRANLFYEDRDLSKAIIAYNDAIKAILSQKIVNYRNLMSVYDNIALCYSHQTRKKDSAFYWYKKIDELSVEKKITKNKTSVSNYAILLIDKKRYKEALDIYNTLDLNRQNNAQIGNILGKAKVLAFLKKFEESKKLNQQAETLCLKNKLVIQQPMVYHNYMLIDSLQGNFQSALNYYAKSKRLLDSIYGIQKLAYTQEMETKYQTSQKEAQIKELALQNELEKKEKQNQLSIGIGILITLLVIGFFLFYRKTQKSKQELQAKENEKLQVENQARQQKMVELEAKSQRTGSQLHGVKNELLMFHDQLKDIAPQAAQQLSRVAAVIRNVSETNYPPDITNSIEQLLQIKIASYETAFAQKGIKCFPNFMVESGTVIDKEIKHSLYRVLEETLNNVYKHSEATEVHLNLFTDEKMLLLSIEDNGKGFDKATVHKNIGFQEYDNYMYLVKGSYDISSEVGRGTMLTFKVPLA
jgi:tetratricopeptide (TPR) repeat protein